MEEKEKKTFITWVKEHKKQLVIAGVSITAIVLAILAVKNRETLMKLWAELKDAIMDITKSADKITVESTEPSVKVGEVVNVVDVINPPALMVVDNTTIDKIPFGVQKHVRNLAPGYHPSPEKIATALENGIELLPNQTWVRDYIKGLAVVA
ncbi:MAG: hypothetical protein K2K21_05680 [Lachnospiraceae bacterium]|nr:hypothetical protein [Lachnospiraceae bacterium]